MLALPLVYGFLLIIMNSRIEINWKEHRNDI